MRTGTLDTEVPTISDAEGAKIADLRDVLLNDAQYNQHAVSAVQHHINVVCHQI